MRSCFIALVISILTLSSGFAHAGEVSWAQHVEERVTEEVKAIVKGFDPAAIVMVRVGVASVKEVDLPGTPFNVGSTTIAGDDGSAMIGSISITILCDRNKLSSEVQALIQKIATVDTVKPQVQYQPLPKGFKMAQDESAADTDARSGKSADKTPSIGEQVRDVIKTSAGSLGSDIRQMLIIGALIIGVTVIGLIFVMFNLVRQVGKIAETIASRDTANAGGSEPAEATRPRKQNPEIAAQPGSKGSDFETANVIQKLPFEAVNELLGDCYWGAHDGYARFVWNRMAVELRKKVIETSPILGSYLSSLGDVREVDLGAHTDPVYLKGLKLAHLDNATLADYVRKQPSLFAIFPRLRVESMGFSILEWVDLNKSEKSPSDKIPDFAGISASKPRDVKVRHKFTKISREDEDAIVGLRDVDVSIVEGVRSMAWIMSIEGDPLKNMLRDFTAQEIAEALDAPQTAVDHVLSHLPDKKRQLTVQYMRKGVANRQSESFDALFNAILSHLRMAGLGPSAESDETMGGGENVSAA